MGCNAVKSPSRILVENGALRLSQWLSVGFHRTLRVPDDGGSYPLPPSFGRFPVYACADYRDRVPKAWTLKVNSVFIPLYQREALWLGFDGQPWHPTAVVVTAGRVNVITGEPWKSPLSGDPQNYVVVPDQPWLDGIRTHAGLVRQFVAVPLGEGFTLDEQLQRRSAVHGIALREHAAKPGRFPDQAPLTRTEITEAPPLHSLRAPTMGIGAGGNIEQKIYPDQYGIGCWKRDSTADAKVYIINSAQFIYVTGRPPPPPVISAADYTKNGFPWFALWDVESGDLGSQSALEQVRSIGSIDASRDAQRQDESLNIPKAQIKLILGAKRPKSIRNKR
jgi:hypothetical protein